MSMPSLDPVTTMDVAPQPVPPLQPLPAVAPMDTTPVTVNQVANTLPNNIVNSVITSAPTNIVPGAVSVPVAPPISQPPVLLPSGVISTVGNKPVVPVSSTPVLNIATPTASSVPPSNRSTVSSAVAPSGASTLHEPTQILSRARLQDLVREVDPTEQLDEEVEELLLQLADDFVETAVNASCLFAKHRRANTIDVKDVQLHLERNWNMWLPGFGTDELRPYKRSTVTEAHKQRLALIRKTLKKY